MAIMGIHTEILKIAQTYGIKVVGENPYTVLSPQDISNKWEAVSTLQSIFYNFSIIGNNNFLPFKSYKLGEVLSASPLRNVASFPTTGEAISPNA